jgi:hypothetical protein
MNDYDEKYVKYRKLRLSEITEFSFRKNNNVCLENQEKNDRITKDLRKNKYTFSVSGLNNDINIKNEVERNDFYKRVKFIEDMHDGILNKLSNTQKVFRNLKTIHSNRAKINYETILKLSNDLNN